MRRLAALVTAALLATGLALPADAAHDRRFSDVADDRYYAEPIAWARQAGVVNGYTEHCFGPDLTATRGEVN